MAKKRISFLVYYDTLPQVESLSDAEKGQLFTAVFKYSMRGEVPDTDNRAIAMVFNFMKAKMDEDNEKYSETCERQKENIEKRWNDKTIPNDTTVLSGIQNDENNTKHTDIDIDLDKDKDLDIDNISSANAELVQNSGENAAVSAHSERSFSSSKHKSMPSANKNSVPYAKIKDLFNAKCDMLPRIRDITETRRRKLSSRWREHPSLSFFEDYFAKVAESDFLCGRVGRFHAGFDWLLEPANMQKVLEGNYENKADDNPFNKPLELDMEGFGDV